MHKQQKAGERRRFRRFRVFGGLFSVIRSDSGKIIGDLTDISSGGMAFLSDPDEHAMSEFSTIDLFQIPGGVCLNNIPLRHVSTTAGYFEINRHKMKMVRNSFDFKTLDPHQKKELGTFIRNYARI